MSDGTDGKGCNQVYAMTAAAAARAIASCRPSGPLQSAQKVDVSAKYTAEQHVLEITVEDTGRAIQGAKQVASQFQQAFLEGLACLCNMLHVHTTGVQESVTRNYTVNAALPSSEPIVTDGTPVAKSCEHGPFSGSKITFSVLDAACAPLQALDAITAALEPITMVAPPVAVSLSISGFEALLQDAGLEPLPTNLKYDLEPLPSSLTPLERMERGFAAFFGPENDDAREPVFGAPSIQHEQVLRAGGEQGDAANVQHIGSSHLSVFLSGSMSAGHTDVDQDGNYPVAAPVYGSPACTRMLLFENYAQLQRPQQALLDAVTKAAFWQSFGTVVQSLSPQLDGTALIVFAPGSAPMAGRIELIAVHLVCADAKATLSSRTGRPAGLSKTLEVKLVRRAIEGALAAAKRAHPLELLSLFEQRMSCLGHIARSVASIVEDSPDVEFQEDMCAFAGCALEDLADTTQEELEQVVLSHMRSEGQHPPPEI